MNQQDRITTAQERITELLEQGSLGGPAATALQATADTEAVVRVLDAVHRHERITELLEQGSLGEPAATELQAAVSESDVSWTLDLSEVVAPEPNLDPDEDATAPQREGSEEVREILWQLELARLGNLEASLRQQEGTHRDE